ncbi:MAG TPA: ribonuclease P protein component [Actinomycetota bacterium]|nr:ribonuclease P protein component [Actinomycetota bacterium]
MPVARSGPAKLRGGAQFRRVLQSRRKAVGHLLAVHALPAQTETRTGFIAGRSVGGAVARNRARRLMRAAWRMVDSTVSSGTHVVLVSRPGIRSAGSAEVAAELTALLRTIGVTNGQGF